VEWILSRDLRGVPPRPSHVQEIANILLQADNPSDSNLLARTGYLPLLIDVTRSKPDMLDDIIIVELNARFQRLSRGGLAAYNRSKCNMASPMKISTTLRNGLRDGLGCNY
jgi:hypothetical protein